MSDHIYPKDDEKKLSYELDQKITNSGTFSILNDGHTIANIIRHSLLEDTRVIFAGYRIPHPLQCKCLIRIRTRTSDVTPIQVLRDSIINLCDEIQTMEEEFRNAIIRKQEPTIAN